MGSWLRFYHDFEALVGSRVVSILRQWYFLWLKYTIGAYVGVFVVWWGWWLLFKLHCSYLCCYSGHFEVVTMFKCATESEICIYSGVFVLFICYYQSNIRSNTIWALIAISKRFELALPSLNLVGFLVLVYIVFSATDPKRNTRDSHVPVRFQWFPKRKLTS